MRIELMAGKAVWHESIKKFRVNLPQRVGQKPGKAPVFWAGKSVAVEQAPNQGKVPQRSRAATVPDARSTFAGGDGMRIRRGVFPSGRLRPRRARSDRRAP